MKTIWKVNVLNILVICAPTNTHVASSMCGWKRVFLILFVALVVVEKNAEENLWNAFAWYDNAIDWCGG